MNTYLRIKLLACFVVVVLCAWLAWLYHSKTVCESGHDEPGVEGAAGLGPAATPHTTPRDILEKGAGASREVISMRERAVKRVQQIRAAQEQLRAGADPGEVKEPEGGK